MSQTLRPPPAVGLLREALGPFEIVRLLLRFPQLAQLPRGRGEPVVVLPGYGAGDASTAVLRGALRGLGYRPQGWALGRNTGHVPALLPRVAARVVQVVGEADGPVILVGWSLGGYLAREVARDRPDLVSHVVTLGSPVVGGPKYTAAASAYERQGADLDAIESAVEARYRRPLATPVTAVYSRSDAVVDWRACIDRRSPNVEHVEVATTHLGMGFSPDVIEVIARALSRNPSGS